MKANNSSYYHYLILLSFLSFGSHYTHASILIFSLYLIQIKYITPFGIGIFIASFSITSMILPIFIGYIIDQTKKIRDITIVLLLLIIIGTILFIITSYYQIFLCSILSLIIFGAGASSITTIQRILLSFYLKDDPSFTTGFYIALANVAKALGKTTIVPLAMLLGSYYYAMLLPLLTCFLSLLSYIIFINYYKNDNVFDQQYENDELFNIDMSSNHINHQELLPLNKDLHRNYTKNTELTHIQKHTNNNQIELINSLQSQQVSPTTFCLQTIIPPISSQDKRARKDYSKNVSNSISLQDTVHLLSEPQIDTEKENLVIFEEYNDIQDNVQVFKDESIGFFHFREVIMNLPRLFLWYAGLHSLYLVVFHVLINFIPHYAMVVWKDTIIDAAAISAIPAIVTIILSPLIGLIVDKIGYGILICTLASINALVAYSLLIYSQCSLVIIIILISISQSLILSLTLAEITKVVPDCSLGSAFGVIEVIDSIVSVFANTMFGALFEYTNNYHLDMFILFGLSLIGMILFIYVLIVHKLYI